MLKTKVKASSITNLTDARYFAAWEAEWLGFDFDTGSEEHIPVQNMIAIKEWIDGVKIVGEFGPMHSAADITAAIELVGLDSVQLGMLVESSTAIELNGVSIIKEFVVQNDTTEEDIAEHFSNFAACTDSFLLDFSKSNFNWEILQTSEQITVDFIKELCQEFKIIIGLDFSGDMIDDFLENILPLGIHVKGGEEEKVGFKSFDVLDEMFENLEIFV
ncbi:MAG: phosphoribosylanthranilate isomerase [Saprospiraceae bacterium]|jgi:phosphoribosylanthranilate isomerase